MIRRPPRSTHCISSAASDVYKRQCVNGYRAYDIALPTDQLPQDFIDCHKMCNINSPVQFFQNIVYGCLISCDTTANPPTVALATISNMQSCLLYTSPSPRDQA
eukprot:TRINITY_DN15046_c0_g1_i2.p2 TRINITY_DN15046_c0_g1~~TRINITY_DN15046_c0_g1_i2.p2  ORF type:complete len:104 (-),score=26.39 TRINITY_DN15046_c0_g1_i2:79-390(-)